MKARNYLWALCTLVLGVGSGVAYDLGWHGVHVALLFLAIGAAAGVLLDGGVLK